MIEGWLTNANVIRMRNRMFRIPMRIPMQPFKLHRIPIRTKIIRIP